MKGDRPDIVPVLRHYGADDVPTGYNWRAMRCCFHDDRNASAQVNTDTGFFRCFTCDFFGDAIEIVKWKEGKGFDDAVTIAEGLAGGADSGSRAAAGPGSGVSGKPWHQRGNSKARKAGGGGYFGTYSR